MALELSKSTWKVGFEYQGKRRIKNVPGGEVSALRQTLDEARHKLGVPAGALVRCCYEAGRDGFWLHRLLEGWGVQNVVVDPASIEVSRQARRAKTDRVDLQSLLSKLRQYHAGELGVWKVAKVPSEQDEEGRLLHRELERLKKERTAHVLRIKALLFAQGVRVERVGGKKWAAALMALRRYDGRALPADLMAQVRRESERLAMVQAQITAIEKEQARRVREAAQAGGAMAMVRALRQLKGIGPVAAWVFVMEFFGWRQFKNGKQVGALAGLTGTPYASGQMQREQGISKAGNQRVRALAVEIAWLWLRHQPDSAISRWYAERFAGTSKRHKRVGIVAVARKLLVALWRYLDTGERPAGARLKAARA
jgi:transposase